MITTREPYEFMCRWIPAGVPDNPYAGTVQAQIDFANVIRDGEAVVVSWTPDAKGPFHVALSGDNGIPLSEIIPSLNAAALAALAEAQALVAQLQTSAAAKDAELAEAAATIAGKDAEIATLTERIAELTPPEQPRIPPVSRMQAMLALYNAGLLDAVNAIVAAADPRTRLAWETATDFHRTSPTIAALWAALGKTDAELDALFIAAKQIEV